MFKFATHLPPFLYDVLISRPRVRTTWNARVLRYLQGASLGVYTLAGVRITSDTGLAPWEPRFWLILVPLFVLGEWALHELSRLLRLR